MSETDEKKQPEVGPQKGEPGKVGVKLAHPLSRKALERLYLDPDTPANVNDVIVVAQDLATSLIGAGMVQVNPNDTAAVHEIIKGAQQSALGIEPSGASGNADPTDDSAREQIVPGSGLAYGDLAGDALKEALKARGLKQSGSADDQRKAVAEHDAQHGPPA